MSAEEKLARAELAEELGFYPASLAPDDVERHRRLNTVLDAAPCLSKIRWKWRFADQQRGTQAVEDLGSDRRE